MRIEIEPIANDSMDADTIWQLAGYALSNCRIHIEFDEGDADGVAKKTRITRYMTESER